MINMIYFCGFSIAIYLHHFNECTPAVWTVITHVDIFVLILQKYIMYFSYANPPSLFMSIQLFTFESSPSFISHVFPF